MKTSVANRSPGIFTTAILFSLLGVGLLLTPQAWSESVRLHLFTALRPGVIASQHLAESATQTWQAWTAPRTDNRTIDRLTAELDTSRDRARQASLFAARLQQELARQKKQGQSPWHVAQSPALLALHVVSARILSPRMLVEPTGQPIIDAGLAAGLQPQSLVTANRQAEQQGRLLQAGAWNGSETPAKAQEPAEDLSGIRWIDQGEQSLLDRGQPVFAGRCFLGRLQDVGQHVSQVQLITSDDFRGFAQVLRQTDGGYSLGAQGILAGTGTPLCELEHVSATEPIAVGDEVYTAGEDAPGGQPLFYGRIVSAELAADGQRWRIRVRPAIRWSELSQVHVLGHSVNPLRTAAN